MHDEIKRFTREGKLRDDSDIIRLKDVLAKDLENEMRSDGYIPVIDIDIHWSTEYNHEEKFYAFKISLYGVYVGLDKISNSIAYYNGSVHTVR